MLHTGRGGEADLSGAIEWYQRAARQGHASAQYVLASLYQHGEGVEANEAEAAKWFKAAAAQGVAAAQLLLADCYLRGRGVPEDYVLAYVWFNHAAAQGLDLASKYKRLTERCMTPDQIASAQEKTRTMAAA